MTPEQSAWTSIRPMLTGMGLDPHRVENVVGPGHPDVDYSHGNIELKAVLDFPVRSSTPVRLPEFTGEQAGWLAKRWEAGGLSWLFVRVGREWFLFDGWTALQVQRGLDAIDWRELSALHYPAPRDGWRGAHASGWHCYSKQLHDWLTFRLDRMMPWSRARAMRLRCRKTLTEVASDINWSITSVCAVERGILPGRVDDLLDYWNS
jgi:hypothetical protein